MTGQKKCHYKWNLFVAAGIVIRTGSAIEPLACSIHWSTGLTGWTNGSNRLSLSIPHKAQSGVVVTSLGGNEACSVRFPCPPSFAPLSLVFRSLVRLMAGFVWFNWIRTTQFSVRTAGSTGYSPVRLHTDHLRGLNRWSPRFPVQPVGPASPVRS